MSILNSERVYANIGFDVLHDGEKHHRVEKGVLFEFDGDDDLFIHISPDNRLMFYEIMDAMFEMFSENDWHDDFLKWKLAKMIHESKRRRIRMMQGRKEKVEGKIEFDVLIDGNYRERVSRGVLLKDNRVGCSLMIRGDEITVFNAFLSLERHIKDRNLTEKLEAYRLVVDSEINSDDDAEEFMKAISLLLEDEE